MIKSSCTNECKKTYEELEKIDEVKSNGMLEIKKEKEKVKVRGRERNLF